MNINKLYEWKVEFILSIDVCLRYKSSRVGSVIRQCCVQIVYAKLLKEGLNFLLNKLHYNNIFLYEKKNICKKYNNNYLMFKNK